MKRLLLILLVITSTLTFANNTEEPIKTVYSDSKTAISTMYNDAKSLAPKIENSIKSIAKGLKIGAESVWDILVKQQLVWSICFSILTLSSLLNWYSFYRRMYPPKNNIEYTVLKRETMIDIPNPKYDKYYANRSDYSGDVRSKETIKGPSGAWEEYNAPKETVEQWSNTKEAFHWLHFCICATLSYFSFIHFADMMTGFINPEFGAMKNIAELALQLK